MSKSMTGSRFSLAVMTTLLILNTLSCKKDKEPDFTPREIVYEVTGTHFKLNYIDSNSAWKNNEEHTTSFRYKFLRAPGTSIGISIYRFSATDEIYSWSLTIDGQPYANAFSEGGAYMTIPYR